MNIDTWIADEPPILTEKGLEVQIRGHPFRRKGYPHPLIAEPLLAWKRGAITILRLVVSPWRMGKHLDEFCGIVLRFRPAQGLKIISLAPRHIFEVLEEVFGEKNWVWAVLMVLEYDDGYRYAVQMVLSKLNKENFYRHPRQECLRLIKIYQNRQNDEYTNQKINTLKPFLWLFYWPKYAKMMRQVVKKLDLNKIALDKADRYFAKIGEPKTFNFDE